MSARSLLLFLAFLCLTIINSCSSETRQSALSNTNISGGDSLYSWFQHNFEEDLADSPKQQTYPGLIDDLDAYERASLILYPEAGFAAVPPVIFV
jgi:actin-related protein